MGNEMKTIMIISILFNLAKKKTKEILFESPINFITNNSEKYLFVQQRQ